MLNPLSPPRSGVLRGPWRDAVHRGQARMAEQLGLPSVVLGSGDERAPGALAFAWRRRFHPPTRKALRRAAEAFDNQPWRDALREWEDTLRPDQVMQGMRLAAAVPTQLSDRELAGFLDRCLEHLGDTLETAGALGLAGGLVHADFARACGRWAQATGAEVAAMFPAQGTLRAGARHELAALREALLDTTPLPLPVSEDAAAEPDAVLLDLAGRRDALGRAVRAYLDRVRLRVVMPLDVSSPTVWEQPRDVLALLEDMARNLGRAAVGSGASAHIAAVRERVPASARGDFETMVAEARGVQRLLEEPVHMTTAWALGVTRQALLHAGDRLARNAVLPEAELIFEALPEELPDLLAGRGPDVGTLQARRAPADPAHAPAPTTVPVAWLPRSARRVASAARLYLAAE